MEFPKEVFVSDEARHLLSALMTKDSSERIPLDAVVRHAWMQVNAQGTDQAVAVVALLALGTATGVGEGLSGGEDEMQIETAVDCRSPFNNSVI